MAEKAPKPRILCVDDEPELLAAITLNLRRRFDVTTAGSGAEGLQHLASGKPFAAVMSDMRMPQMDGATFLATCRVQAPETVRLLLTGQSDMQAAISAVNDGQVFRFLTKPCMPDHLIAALDAACNQHRLQTIERDMLETTLRGSVQALIDILALTNPVAFGRAGKIKGLVTELCEALEVRDRWHIEVAAMLSQLGWVTLPAQTAEKLYYGHELAADERALVEKLPEVVEKLLGNIPRLDRVTAMLGARATVSLDVRGGQILRVARDFDALCARGMSVQAALDTMVGRGDAYDRDVIDALARTQGGAQKGEIRVVPISLVRVGMTFLDDVMTSAGVMLVPSGYEVTESFVARANAFRPGYIKEPLRVLVKVKS